MTASTTIPGFAIRDYTPTDEQSWLRCRVLSFLNTPYFDDVLTSKTPIAAPGFDLVALDAGGTVVGIIDRKSTRLNSSHSTLSRMPSSA